MSGDSDSGSRDTSDKDIKNSIGKVHSKKESKNSGFVSDVKANFEFGSNYFSSTLKEYPWAIPLFCVIFLVGFAFFITTLNADLSHADDLASRNVDRFIFNDILNDLSQKYPTLDSGVLQSRALAELNEVKNSGVYKGTPLDFIVESNAEGFRGIYSSSDGNLYPLTIDAYFWLNLMDNKIETGRLGDFVVNDTDFVATLAPNGAEIENPNLYPSLIVFFSKVFGSDVFSVASFYPVVVSMLVSVFAFFAARRIAGNLAGFFSGVLVVLLPAISRDVLFLQIDTDAFVVFFSVLLSWLFIELIYSKSLKKSLILSGVSSLFVGLFSSFWAGGWFFIFDLILFCFFVATVYLFFLKCGFYKRLVFNVRSFFPSILSSFKVLKFSVLYDDISVRRFFFSFILFCFSSLIFVSLFSSFSAFSSAFTIPLSSGSAFDFPFVEDGLWPNVFTSVAELMNGSVPGAVFSAGGWFILLFTFSGLLVYLLGGNVSISKRFKFGLFFISFAMWVFGLILGHTVSSSNLWFVYFICLLFFIPFLLCLKVVALKGSDFSRVISSFFLFFVFLASLYSAFVAVRFGLFLSFAVVIPFGVAVSSLFSLFVKFIRSFGIPLPFSRVFILFLLLLVFFLPVNLYGLAHSAVDDSVPHISDSLYDASSFVRSSTSENAIITSWWDFGHPFRYISDRAVTFDGSSQDSPQAHWVGKLLLSSSDEEALGILRMLNCGGNFAFDKVLELSGGSSDVDFVLSKRVVDEVVSLDSVGARDFLVSEDFSDTSIDEILSFTHCSAPDSVLIVSSDMVGKSGVWSHFGSWNFDKVAFWKSFNDGSDISGLDLSDSVVSSWRSEAKGLSSNALLDSWLAPFPGLLPVPGSCSVVGGSLSCSVDDSSNPIDFSVSYDGSFLSGDPRVASVVFSDGISVHSVSSGSVSGVLSLVVVPSTNGEFDILVSDSSALANSLFVRLYFFNGLGVDSFSNVYDSGFDFSGSRFIVYRAVW